MRGGATPQRQGRRQCTEGAWSHPSHSDICLLLRAHAEQGWLRREVLPVVDQIERTRARASSDSSVALAYLEVVWTQARLRACETDATLAWLERADGATHLSERRCSYTRGGALRSAWTPRRDAAIALDLGAGVAR